MQIAFVFGVYNEWSLASRLVNQIRTLYPQAPAIAICDGTFNADFAQLCDLKGISFIASDRIKLPQFGGAWSQRLFTEFLKTDADILIKLDPDTYLWRCFTSFPDTDWFGTQANKYLYPYPRGGCVGFRRKCIERFIASNLLGHPKYKNHIFAYDRYGRWGWEHDLKQTEPISLQDWVLADVAHQLKLKLGDWSEVNIQFRQIVANHGLRWAATHPMPLINSDRG